jgi:hypothetical protein
MLMITVPIDDTAGSSAPAAAADALCRQAIIGLLLVFWAMGLCGCAALLSNAAADLSDDLAYAITDADDLETVEAGGPAYLLMVDGLIHGNPRNTRLLQAGATLYSAYAGIYVDDEQRAQKMTAKARAYALQAACSRRREWCDLEALDFDGFNRAIEAAHKKDVPLLYDLGAAWAGWIQARQRDWDAIAQISRVEALMQRVVVLDESHRQGGAHLYLGVLATLLPPAMGGEPEKGRAHFERAIALSNGRNLMAKVSFAKHYSRLVFDRDLHDRLLQEVLDASPKAPGHTLLNVVAQQQARGLLDSGDDYF